MKEQLQQLAEKTSPSVTSPAHLRFYRTLILLGAIGIPAFGLVDWGIGYDPFAARVAFSFAAFGLLAASYISHATRRHFRLGALALCLSLTVWFVYIAVHHSMTMADVVGLLPIVVGYSAMLRRAWEVVFFVAFLIVSLIVGYSAVDEPVVSLTVPVSVLVMFSLVLGTMSVWRTQLEEALSIANRSLETNNQQLASALENLKQAQDQLIQTEKMASLGVLVSGVAHELKNPLNFVNNFADLALDFMSEYRESQGEAQEALLEVEENLDRIRHHGRRADQIINTMLLHVRSDGAETTRVGLGVLVAEQARLAIFGFCGDDTPAPELVESYDPAAGEVVVPLEELSNLVVNLVSNACHTMRRRAAADAPEYRPRLELGTRRVDDAIELHVVDNGEGMKEEIRRRIFDPFFTTKPPGEGTGLGLTLAYETVVARLGGSIEVTSEPGKGSAFIVRLPTSSLR